MTFEELKELRRKTEDVVCDAYQALNRAEWAYLNENLPFPLKMYQRVTVTAEVTEETRKLLIDEYRAKPRYQLGKQYRVTGMLTGYCIGKKGELRPCFWGGKPSYSLNDKIIKIEIAKKQNSEKCTDCVYYRDGGCWMTGNSKTEPDKKVDEDSFICGWYRERVK